jgi:hypothetical protein
MRKCREGRYSILRSNNSLSKSPCLFVISGFLSFSNVTGCAKISTRAKRGKDQKRNLDFMMYTKRLGLPGFQEGPRKRVITSPKTLFPRGRPLKTSSWREFVAFDTIRTWRRLLWLCWLLDCIRKASLEQLYFLGRTGVSNHIMKLFRWCTRTFGISKCWREMLLLGRPCSRI